jgi:predicted dehydrogenase
MEHVAIIGAGIRGRMYESALRAQQGIEIVGFVEPSARVAEEASAATGLVAYPDIDKMLEAKEISAAIIATPDFAHHDAAVRLAREGCDLLIEKPIATTVEEARRIAAAVRSAGVRCLVGFENRWNPHFVRAKELIDDGAIGRVLTQRAVLSNTYFVAERMLSWAARSSPAWFLIPHTADLAVWLAGRRPVSVVAVATEGILAGRGVDTWDTVDAMLRFDDGTVANLSSSWIEPESLPGIVEFTYAVTGTEGGFRADLSDQGLHVAGASYSSVWPVSGQAGNNLIGASIWMARDWAAMLRGEIPWGPDADDGVFITQLVAAIETSVSSGAWVDIGA